MKKLIKVILLFVILSLTTLYAGAGHNHDTLEGDISNTKVKEIATVEVQRLVAEKKILKSWKSAVVSKMGRTHYGDNDDWIVAFNNLKIKRKKYQNLYIFVSKRGEIRGANYTGN